MKRIFVALQVCSLLLLAGLAGCLMTPRLASPAELTAMGTRHYRSVNEGQGLKAAQAALKTLGFQVTAVNRRTGTILTAPHQIGESAVATSDYSAVAFEDELAWKLRVSPDGSGVVMRATPRAYVNGNSVPRDKLPYEAIKPKFDSLWRAVNEVLGS